MKTTKVKTVAWQRRINRKTYFILYTFLACMGVSLLPVMFYTVTRDTGPDLLVLWILLFILFSILTKNLIQNIHERLEHNPHKKRNA